METLVRKETNVAVRPFTVNISQETLDDLHTRLVHTRWTDAVTGADWDYGTNAAYLRELLAYWQHGFDWRTHERVINQFAQFRATVDGFGLHFIHERGKGTNPLPLALFNSWPGSFYLYTKLIPLLTDPASHGGDAADAFDVVVPSLPGYGFSDRPTERGMTVNRMADLFAKLMTDSLGYPRFAAQGADIGAGVVGALAQKEPELLVGVHMEGGNPYIFQVPDNLSPAEKQFVDASNTWMQAEGAYAAEQSTKPQTLAYGLNDSPAGLAAWIVEKLRAWSDCGGDIEKRFTKDEILTHLTIYWATETINSSFRVYYEGAHDWLQGTSQTQTTHVPTAIAIYPADIARPPREWLERSYAVDWYTQMARGGHFPEWEEPQLLAEDLRAFFRPLW